jgi:dipeptidyl aminopeptidase/acylaminoacyl peptidase
MRFINSLLFILVCVALTASFGFSQTKSHPFTIHDLLAMERISDPQISPDGRRIVFVLAKTDLEENSSKTDLWMVQTDGKDLRQLTSHKQGDSNPRWDPDGKTIWFLSSRSESSQVWRIRVDGGEALQVTDEPLDVGNLVIAPDGKHMAFTMEVFPDCNGPAETKKKLDEKEENKATGRMYDKIFIRHWNRWKEGRRSHLFVMPAGGGDAVDVMAGMDVDCPSKPFGGPGEIAFTPDSKGLVFAARDAGKTEPWSTDFDLYHVSIDAFAPPKCITGENKAWDTSPVFSPDGKTLAYLATTRPGYESDQVKIILRPWPEGKERVLTGDWDSSMPLWYGSGAMCFAKDGKTIYTTALNLGQNSLFAVDVQTGDVRTVVKEGFSSSPAVAGQRIVFCKHDFKSPADLYSVNADGGDLRAITEVNKERIAQARIGDYEQFNFEGFNKETVYCNVVKPVDLDPDKKYPVIYLIHGGPQASSVNRFSGVQAYAGAGYAVVMVDFHGSAGYGQAFTDSIRDDWGGKPLEDLRKGLAAALERYPWMDDEKVGAMGGSYGGYMINWIAGNWPERFRCLVNICGLFDVRAMYYSTEELWFPEWDLKGTPWENPQSFEKQNPANYVSNWKTPMLVVHGGRDFRVPDTQGISTFTALQRRGIESKLLYYPDEGHGIGKPHNRIQYTEAVIAWFDRWLKN